MAKVKEHVALSGSNQDLDEIVAHFDDVSDSLKLFYSPKAPNFSERFKGYQSQQLKAELNLRLSETDTASGFALLASLEASFRTDYYLRVSMKRKDQLSKAFFALYQSKGFRVSLEEEILEQWKIHGKASNRLIGELRGAFKFRHWLAHGRYWIPKLGQKYDYYSLYVLAERVQTAFTFLDDP